MLNPAIALLGLLTLSACAEGLYLGSTEPATIMTWAGQSQQVLTGPRPPMSTSTRLLTAIPLVGIFAGLADTGTGKREVKTTEYYHAIEIIRIDGKSTPASVKKHEVLPGPHTLDARYCRSDESGSACSEPVTLSFKAKPGKTYSLSRDDQYRLRINAFGDTPSLIFASTKSVVPQDEEDCVRRREHWIDSRLKAKYIGAAKADRLMSGVAEACRDLVWGPLED